MSMLDKAKNMALKAGDQTARKAKQAKLNGDIMLLQRKVKATKEDFGVHVFDAMVAADRPMVEGLFGEARTKIEELESAIANKRAQIDGLKGGSVSGGVAPPMPPPADPAAGGAPPALPEGWRLTKTAEGREYYYHEGTGETSWTVPEA
jgi:hypothetical protein